MSANATELFTEMQKDVLASGYRRKAASPTQEAITVEAQLGRSYAFFAPEFNLPSQKSVDLRWAAANTLHFFGGVEYAAPLLQYNERASCFLRGDFWEGAYGAIAMPQIRECVRILEADKHSRRAVVSMGGPLPSDINRPACWSFLHFLLGRDGLDLLVYQRSLNLYDVMPYDLILLSSILMYAAKKLKLPYNALRWTIGSLHVVEGKLLTPARDQQRNLGLRVPFELLDDSDLCRRVLLDPELHTWTAHVLSKKHRS